MRLAPVLSYITILIPDEFKLYITDIKFQFLCFCHLKAWSIGIMPEDWTERRGWYYSQMGRARGLLAAIERIRNQETPLHQVEGQESHKWKGEEVYCLLPLPR